MPKRISEGEIRLAILNAVSKSPGGFMTTSSLIAELEHRQNPQGTDAKILPGRGDTHFSQKVRNAAGSHVERPSGLAGRGLVVHDPVREGLTITNEGRTYLAALGF